MTADNRRIKLIKAPFAVRTGRPGAEQGAESVMEAGLGRMLRYLGFGLAEETVLGLETVEEMSRRVAESVRTAMEERAFPLVLGGDRSVSIGAIAGIGGGSSKAGLIAFDAHPSLLTEATSSTGYVNEMAMAAVLGGTALDVPGLGQLPKENIVLIGLREVLESERDWIVRDGIRCFTMHDIDRMGIQRVVESALEIAGRGTDGIHVSFDADCLDPLEAPGVVSPVPGGLTFREAHFACELLADSGRITSADVTEVNPIMDVGRRTAKLIAGLVASLLGKKIL